MNAVSNSTQAFYRRSQLQMGDLRGQAERLQQQLATGERLQRSSDDPVAAARLRTLARAERLGEIDAANARRASEDLQLTGDALESIVNDLIRARELALWAGSDTIGEGERSAIASEIADLRQRILSTANALDSSGGALFGGESAGQAYAEAPDGSITYVGSASAAVIDLGEGQNVVRAITGPEVLDFAGPGGPTDVFTHLAALAIALTGGAADPAEAARSALAGLDTALDTVTRAQTVTGARLAWLDVVQDRQIDQSLSRAQQMADTGGVEFTSAIAELQQLLTVLEASQASFTRLSALTLFERI